MLPKILKSHSFLGTSRGVCKGTAGQVSRATQRVEPGQGEVEQLENVMEEAPEGEDLNGIDEDGYGSTDEINIEDPEEEFAASKESRQENMEEEDIIKRGFEIKGLDKGNGEAWETDEQDVLDRQKGDGGHSSVPGGTTSSIREGSMAGTETSNALAKGLGDIKMLMAKKDGGTNGGQGGDTRSVKDSPQGGAGGGPVAVGPQKGHQILRGTRRNSSNQQDLGRPANSRFPREAPTAQSVDAQGGAGAPTGTRETAGTCERAPHVDLAWLLSNSSLAYGMHGCKVYRRVCLDQSAFVMYDEKYIPKNSSGPQMPVFGPLPPQAVVSGLHPLPHPSPALCIFRVHREFCV